ncbi:MAG: mechanosensitive ion channel [Gammaproteobacteria bacterium]|nr:mechanosensitive ion channel [Gammaproteobacteria bacterium]
MASLPSLKQRFFTGVVCALVLGAILGHSAALWAQSEDEPKEVTPEILAKELDSIDGKLKLAIRSEKLLADWVELVNKIKQTGTECVPETEQALEKVNADIASLGEGDISEPSAVINKRRTLAEEKTKLDNRLATCKVLVLRSEELTPKITERRQQLLAQQLVARGPSIIAVLKDERLRPADWLASSRSFVQQHSVVRRLSLGAQGMFVLVLVVAVALGLLLRHWLRAWTLRHRWQKNFSSYLGQSVMTTLSHYAPYLLFSAAAAVFFFFAARHMEPIPLGRLIAYGLPVYFLAAAMTHVFLSPLPPAQPLAWVPKDIGAALVARLKVFFLLVFLGYLVFATLLAQQLPEPALLIARGALAIVFFLNLVWALWLLGQIPGLANTLWLRAILLTVLLTALSAELLGYRNLSVWVLRAIIGTTIVFGILVLVTRLFHELFDGLQTGRHSWHRRLRQAFGLKSGDRVPGLLGIRVLTALALWAIFGLAVLRIWGLSDASMQQLYEWVFAGFTVGSLHINPARIVFALLTLAILVTASGWFRSRLERKWLPRTRMKRGSREALVTISGYSGIAIAVLVTLAISGVEFTNLAIIAGALSVGIGFGLQNIVNNFVSGLILLFERPIKTGDWVVVGATEGYVKRIRIRSTQIQTFDRADVIVPNSDLVSNQVTNWMLHEPRGRVKVPVSVAYGSDTEKVKEILLDIANNHPSVIKDSPQVPNPMVLFLAFGDSSLNFELRCYIDQIDYRLRVLSEMNFAIDKAFREHGIEIPFPQRDLHIRNWPAGEPPAPPKRQR